MEIKDLKQRHDQGMTAYFGAHRRARLLDGVDRGKLWSVLNMKMPNYQLLPDSNHVSYVKNNLLASLYCVGRSADIIPTSEQDKDMVMQLNILIDHLWDVLDIPFFQMQAGERAALMNLGVTEVGWDIKAVGGTGENFADGMPRLRNVNPLKYMRDPYATSIDTSEWACWWDDFPKSYFENDPNYQSEFAKYIATRKDGSIYANQVQQALDKDQSAASGKGYYTLIVYHVIENGKRNVYHVINNEHILYVKQGAEPTGLPFAELYCNLPVGDLIGTSQPSLILANSIVYNLMHSIAATAEYKNQRPPRFVNQQSQIDVRAFTKYGAEADKTFIVQGDAGRAVHYHQFPQVSGFVQSLMGSLGFDIKDITGINSKYTGSDTGSIMTTGGIEQMLDQATLIDQPKIVNYERYTRRLTQLIVTNFLKYAGKRTYYVKNKMKPGYRKVQINFKDIPKDIAINYALSISAHMPKNRQMIANKANMLMEKQMQYASAGMQVELITPEEWLMMQDFPHKEYMLERMGIQRNHDFVEQVSQTIFQYSELVQQGMSPEDAMLATADTLSQRKDAMMEESQP